MYIEGCNSIKWRVVSAFTDIYIEHVEGVFEILMKLKICPISHHTLTLYTRIICILRVVTLLNGELCQHSQTSIEHVEGVFEILMKLKICLISHHTLTLYTRIKCILRVVTLSNGEI